MQLTKDDTVARKKALDELAAYEEQLITARETFKKKQELEGFRTRLKQIEDQFKRENELRNKGRAAEKNVINIISDIPRSVPQTIDNITKALVNRTGIATKSLLGPIGDMKTLLERWSSMTPQQFNDVSGSILTTINAKIAQLDKMKETVKLDTSLTDDQRAAILNSFDQLRNIFAGLQSNMTDVKDSNAAVAKSSEELKKEQEELRKKIGEEFYRDEIINDNTTELDKNTTALSNLGVLIDNLITSLPKSIITEANAIPVMPEPKAFGGMMHGRDNIPALLSKGEFVVNANATRRFYSQLVSMNSVQGFTKGGLVTNVGDIHVTNNSTGNTQADIVAIGNGLRREIRRGRIKF
jgi:hypothetical protein